MDELAAEILQDLQLQRRSVRDYAPSFVNSQIEEGRHYSRTQVRKKLWELLDEGLIEANVTHDGTRLAHPILSIRGSQVAATNWPIS